jgi:glycosidase
MRWNRRIDAPGETHWKPLTANRAAAVSVEAEAADPHSLLNRYRELIGWRIALPALREGDLQAFDSGDAQVLAFVRAVPGQRVLVVHNLSGHAREMPIDPAQGFGALLRQTDADVHLADGRLHLPAYASAVLR